MYGFKSQKELAFGQISITSCLCFLAFCFLTNVAMAKSSYQFSIDASASKINYEHFGKGDDYSVSVSAYLTPVLLDGSVPYEVAPFFKRVARLTIKTDKQNNSDLRVIVNGNILSDSDFGKTQIEIHLADKAISYWLSANYTHNAESNFKFRSGVKAYGNNFNSFQLKPGWFLADNFSIYGLYNNEKQEATQKDQFAYGLGFMGLYDVDQLGFVGYEFNYKKSKVAIPAIAVVNGTPRNIGIVNYVRDEWIAKLSYFPNVKTEFGVAFTYFDSEASSSDGILTHLKANYFITNNFKLGLNYSKRRVNNFFYSPTATAGLGYDSYSIDLSYRF